MENAITVLALFYMLTDVQVRLALHFILLEKKSTFIKYVVIFLAGWWYNYCAYALLNGLYYTGGPYTPSGGYYDGIYWRDWLGYGYSLRFTRMSLSHP